jgi:hypothetical protein
VCRFEAGNAKQFQCPYHGWAFKSDGTFLAAPVGRENMHGQLRTKEELSLVRGRVETYTGMIFVTFDETAPSLRDYLGPMTWYCDLMFDRTRSGMTVLGHPQRFIIPANWKSAAEQFAGDIFHTLTLHRSMQELARRLQQVVGRIQQFTNLDQAEIREVDLNGLVRDVHVLVERQAGSDVALKLNLNPVPPLVCRPQQLSAVFLSLLNNAIRAVGSGGAIVVNTRQRDRQIEVEIRDAGRGMATQELRTIFDPGFRVSDDQVVRGHWSMYAVRQIVGAHGGEIRITSKRNRGTTVTVTLPLNQGESRA